MPPEFCIWGADVPSPSVFLALRAGAWGLLLLPQGGPLFSALLTLGDPALLPGRWWACVRAHPFPAALPAPSALRALPSQPQLGTKVNRGITVGALE